MGSNLTWRNLAVAVVVATVLGVVAGTLLDGNSNPQTSSLLDDAFRLVPTATVAPDVLAASVRSGEISALVLIQGIKERRLVVWPLDSTNPPMKLSDRSAHGRCCRTQPARASATARSVP